MSKGPKNGHFGLKMAILDFKAAMDLSKNIFILSAAKSCTIESGIINFIILFNTFLSLRCQMAILGLKMASLYFKMAMDIFENTFI